MDLDFSNFEKEDFSIPGFYRALVEDNVDPTESGRLRVRILGIHSLDVNEAPTGNLPWAEPVIPLAHSGGANLQNIDTVPGAEADPLTKYEPSPVTAPLDVQLPEPATSDAVIPGNTEYNTIPIFKDKNLCNSGTGGLFSVPAKGSLVWVFFDGGCHLRPHYFAMATQKRDWSAQKLKITGDLQDRDDIVNNINKDLQNGVDDTSVHDFTGKAIANKASISTDLQPEDITPKSSDFSQNTRLENITSWTSPGGTTIVSNHTWKNEELFIIHKGYSHYVDSNGNVIKIVGKTSPNGTNSKTAINSDNSSGDANDETEINAGLKNVYVVGNYNLFVLSDCNIQCNQSVQINAKGNVGVVSREGNINILAKQGSINLEATNGSINFKTQDMQFEVDNNFVLKAQKLIDLNSSDIIKIKSITTTISESASLQHTATTDFIVKAEISLDLVSQGECNIASQAKTTITSTTLNLNGDSGILINSAQVELKGASSVNIQAQNIDIKGNMVNVNGDGSVSVLGGNLSVYGNSTAMLGGSIATFGGGTTTLTGIITMGIGAVVPGAPATPVNSTYESPKIKSPEAYAETEFIYSKDDFNPNS